MSDDLPQFVDTNVLVYAHDRSASDKRQRALGLIDELWQSRRGRLSIQVLQEFYVNATRKIPVPLPADHASEIVALMGRWTTHSPAVADVVAAVEFHVLHQISFWDAMIVRSAAALGCGVIWSEDLADGESYESVTVRNPFASDR